MRSREPSHAREVLVARTFDQPRGGSGKRSVAGRNGGCKLLRLRLDISRNEDDVVLKFPRGRAGALLVVGRDAVFHQRRLPAMSDDQRPEKEEALTAVEKQDRVGLGKAGGIRHREWLGPAARRVAPTRASNQHVVSRALAGAVEPADEQ